MRRRLSIGAFIAVMALALTGCAAADAQPEGEASRTIAVVASTDVWGNIAEQIGGSRVSVTSLISDPNRDPHDYEATGQNQLSLSKARVLIENGGGYDDFVNDMVNALGSTRLTIVNAADVSGFDQNPPDGNFNQHLWYDFPTVTKVAARLASAFSKLDPAGASTFVQNDKAFAAKVAARAQTELGLRATYAGTGVAITEPVPLYMLDAIGLDDKTPQKFSEAIENDTDVAPDILQQTLGLFSARSVKLLVYNEQTVSAQTEAIVAAAHANRIPVVPVTETLPAGKNYLSWMTANLAAIARALGAKGATS